MEHRQILVGIVSLSQIGNSDTPFDSVGAVFSLSCEPTYLRDWFFPSKYQCPKSRTDYTPVAMGERGKAIAEAEEAEGSRDNEKADYQWEATLAEVPTYGSSSVRFTAPMKGFSLVRSFITRLVRPPTFTTPSINRLLWLKKDSIRTPFDMRVTKTLNLHLGYKWWFDTGEWMEVGVMLQNAHDA